jgi:Ca2+-binding EF-hand superfamily protein
MLRNMLAESFPARQDLLRQTAEKMFREGLTDRMWRERMFRGVPLKNIEDVVYHLFNKRDGKEIMKRIKDPVRKNKIAADEMSTDNARYHTCIESILTFNMNLQDDFLHDFIYAFRELDKDSSGRLSQDEIQKLVARFGTVPNVSDSASSAQRLIDDAQAFTLRKIGDAKRMTFSEMVDCFTELLSARWSVTGKKGNRYRYHDGVKHKFQREAKDAERLESERKQTGAEVHVKSAMKKIETNLKEHEGIDAQYQNLAGLMERKRLEAATVKLG